MNKLQQILLDDALRQEWFRLDDMMSRMAFNDCEPLPCKIFCSSKCVVRNMINMHWGRYVIRN